MDSSILYQLAIIIATLVSSNVSLRWHMEPNTQKCFSKKLRQHELVNGVYEVTTVLGQQIDYIIKDSNNHLLSQDKDINSGKFTFSLEYDDIFEICFISKVLNNPKRVFQEIFLDIKIDVEVKNYEKVFKTFQYKSLELNLKHLEDLSQDIEIEFRNMKKQIDELHDTKERTKTTVFYFRILSISCLVILAVWQVIYLKRYFISKKLID